VRLTLVPLDNAPVPLAKKVAARLRRIVPWTIKTSPPLTCGLSGNQQGQVDAREALRLLPGGERHNMLTVGISDDDLVAPGLDFVYGHAMPERRTGVVSLHRLRPVSGSSAARQQVLLERTCKEVLHEAGHVLGLAHCQDFMCVMHYSQAIQDTDRKRCGFCPRCMEELSRLPEGHEDK
jgi:predicted Zn-dependent protease